MQAPNSRPCFRLGAEGELVLVLPAAAVAAAVVAVVVAVVASRKWSTSPATARESSTSPSEDMSGTSEASGARPAKKRKGSRGT